VKRLADAQRAPVVDHKRIVELEDQVANLEEAIATGALKSSPAARRSPRSCRERAREAASDSGAEPGSESRAGHPADRGRV
jgi:hypothetical protein